jgi:hypothetical protein
MSEEVSLIDESAEGAVLEALSGRRWRMSAEIADESALPAPVVRLVLQRLRERGILDRNIRGEWQIISATGRKPR